MPQLFMAAAARPFGMVKLVPDTQIYGNWSTGYQNSLNTIDGFSRPHGWKLGGAPDALSDHVILNNAGLVNECDRRRPCEVLVLLGPRWRKSTFEPKHRRLSLTTRKFISIVMISMRS